MTEEQIRLLRKQCAATRAGRAAVEAGTFDQLFEQHLSEITVTRLDYHEACRVADELSRYPNPCVASTIVRAPAERTLVPHLDHHRARWNPRGWVWTKHNLANRSISMEDADLV